MDTDPPGSGALELVRYGRYRLIQVCLPGEEGHEDEEDDGQQLEQGRESSLQHFYYYLPNCTTCQIKIVSRVKQKLK